MIVKAPFFITSRLEPGIKVGDAVLSIDFASESRVDGRAVYRVSIDFADGTEFVDESLKSGVGGGSLREGMASYLAFLGAAVESSRYGRNWLDGPKGDGAADLFPKHVVEWADQHDSEIAAVQWEIEETKDCLT